MQFGRRDNITFNKGDLRCDWELHGAFFMYTDFTATYTSALLIARLMKLQ